MSEDLTKLKKDQRRDSILESALKVISDKGLEATTMREIAKEENISETLLYRFFSNKEEIFIGILMNKAKKTIDEIEEALETIKGMIPDPKISLPIIWKIVKKRFDDNFNVISLLINERETIRDLFQKFRSIRSESLDTMPIKIPIFEHLQKMQVDQFLTDYFKRCQDANNLRKDIEAKYIARVFMNLIMSATAPIPPPLRLKIGLQNEEDIENLFLAQLEILLYGIVPKEKL
ncbi:MAG: helix-turn-helix transcriptional regulator [Candidatus Heimdallarchaeota archaeon]|nr:helix-turn-helix transcriptional regulator [Candidatus Heimdallarchaeota archaeon]